MQKMQKLQERMQYENPDKKGHVIDPDTKLDQVADVLLEDDKIQEVKENIKDNKLLIWIAAAAGVTVVALFALLTSREQQQER